uniref:Vacuolar protein-sorting-associated protein 36 n=1 Tax=Trichuris muris TaxID=70415 RepID=A0A5S6QX50_TRIMR
MRRAGIVGIERQLENKRERNAGQISRAFQDLAPLMAMAKDMVNLAKCISTEIRDKTGAISADETVQLKSHLLCLGIDDPVTRSHAAGDSASYVTLLARECASVLHTPIENAGGLMTIYHAYVYVNRARGFELISPNDFRNACSVMELLQLPIRMVQFRSGVLVLVTDQFDSEGRDNIILDIIATKGCSNAEELSSLMQIPVLLTMERLLAAEDRGLLCRDETLEGLSFYPNKFLSNDKRCGVMDEDN